MLDQFLWGKVSRISPEAPVPVVDVTRESFFPGGAANVARNLRALGAKRLDGKTFETQSTGFVDFKFAELKAARPKINRQE